MPHLNDILDHARKILRLNGYSGLVDPDRSSLANRPSKAAVRAVERVRERGGAIDGAAERVDKFTKELCRYFGSIALVYHALTKDVVMNL